jgi:outer membrane murein-binding lipoprotein Lpp
MVQVPSFGAASGRRRKRWSWWSLVRLALVLGLLLLGTSSAYQVGVSQSATELARLRRDVQELQEANRQLTERTAAAEQRAAMVVARVTQAERSFEARMPSGDAKRLLGIVESKLRGGIDPERIAFVLAQVDRPRNCEPRTETKKLQPRTTLSTAPLSAVTFLNDRVTVTGQGATARNAAGQPETFFDAAQPVELRFTKIGGGVETARGMLPLTHALVVGDRELLFAARIGDKPGIIDFTMQSCAYP